LTSFVLNRHQGEKMLIFSRRLTLLASPQKKIGSGLPFQLFCVRIKK